ncbi:hypothetical protein CR513_17364, partial [Mucuna pruriens]
MALTGKIAHWHVIVEIKNTSNALGHGIEVVLISPKDHCFPFTARLGFNCINNMAEYEACAIGIIMALEYQVKTLKLYGDFTLVIHQLRGEWETRDVKLVPYCSYVKELTEHFERITFHHIHHEENQMVDALATLASMFEISQEKDTPILRIQHQAVPIYCQEIEEETDGKLQYYDIMRYIKDQEYPSDIIENNKKNLEKIANRLLPKWGRALQKKLGYDTASLCGCQRS